MISPIVSVTISLLDDTQGFSVCIRGIGKDTSSSSINRPSVIGGPSEPLCIHILCCGLSNHMHQTRDGAEDINPETESFHRPSLMFIAFTLSGLIRGGSRDCGGSRQGTAVKTSWETLFINTMRQLSEDCRKVLAICSASGIRWDPSAKRIRSKQNNSEQTYSSAC